MSDILVVDNDLGPFEPGLRQALRGHRLHLAYSGPEGLAQVEANPDLDVVLLDIMMPPEIAEVEAREGLEVLKRIKQARPELPVIMLTVLDDVDVIVEAVQEGAFHYIKKPIDRDKLRDAVARATENSNLRQRLRSMSRAKEAVLTIHTGGGKARDRFAGMLGAHPLMQELYDKIERAARFDDMNVVILGETGSGKDLVARAIHECSPRKNEAFVAVNCAALAESVLDAELFGHEKGAFTGADQAREGLFTQADGGTLFLDEIGEMSPALQSKLLRAIENDEVRPVGGEPIRVDVRIICATNTDLTSAKDTDKFREDLYYRIWDIPLTLAPLRKRKQDIPMLAAHFVADCAAKNNVECSIDRSALAALTEHDWPGNVRELSAAVRRLVVFAEAGRITEPLVRESLGLAPPPGGHAVAFEAIPAAVLPPAPQPTGPPAGVPQEKWPQIADLAEFRKVHGERKLRRILEQAVRTGGNARDAMALIGLPEDRYDMFRKWLQRLDVRVRRLKGER
ncbi:MAG: sigma-54-dependent Fis family transcriptional regulator [Candidatus Hydrogenedentes bacterium]|nr:sigma-54-dependent Fis family transcriptional regulator [Candidatus Hydrogenedentota bacterium]